MPAIAARMLVKFTDPGWLDIRGDALAALRHGNLLQVARAALQGRWHAGPFRGCAVTSDHQLRVELRKCLDRGFGGLPVRREIAGRAVHLDFLHCDLVARLLSGSDEGVPGNEGFVG